MLSTGNAPPRVVSHSENASSMGVTSPQSITTVRKAYRDFPGLSSCIFTTNCERPGPVLSTTKGAALSVKRVKLLYTTF